MTIRTLHDALETRTRQQVTLPIAAETPAAPPRGGCVNCAFDDPEIDRVLSAMTETELDDVPFGVIGLDADSVVQVYNAWESRNAGLAQSRVIGRPFFTEIAPCMNNYLVAERFEQEAPLDVTIPYVLTFRMRPTPVRLRLVRGVASSRRWVLILRE